jgi:hypothetical protein
MLSMSKETVMNVLWMCNECNKGPCTEHKLVNVNEQINWDVMTGCIKDPSLNKIAFWSINFGGEE